MANTYTWKIDGMDSYPSNQMQTHVVMAVNWTATATDDSTPANTASVSKSTNINCIEGISYTPFESLTQEQVVSWLWTNGVLQSEVEAALDKIIENKINPPAAIVPPQMPWATQE